MPTPAERQRLAALAARELAAPVAAYDQITLDGSHPLAYLTKDGPIAGTIRAATTAVRGATKAVNYLSKDKENSMPYPRSMAPRGGYRSGGYDVDPDLDAEDPDPTGGGSMDPQEAYETIQAVLSAVSPADRSQFIARLREYCDAEGTGSAPGAADRARKRLAMDARAKAGVEHRRAFLQRYPGAANIDVGQIPAWVRRDV